MRLLISGLCLIALVLTFCVVNFMYVKNSLDSIADQLDLIETDIKDHEWEKAETSAQNVNAEWKEKEKYYMAVLWHQHIDDATVALHQLISAIEMNDEIEAKSTLIEARTIIRDIVEMESFSLENIL